MLQLTFFVNFKSLEQWRNRSMSTHIQYLRINVIWGGNLHTSLERLTVTLIAQLAWCDGLIFEVGYPPTQNECSVIWCCSYVYSFILASCPKFHFHSHPGLSLPFKRQLWLQCFTCLLSSLSSQHCLVRLLVGLECETLVYPSHVLPLSTWATSTWWGWTRLSSSPVRAHVISSK